jgi:hypothetical protein
MTLLPASEEFLSKFPSSVLLIKYCTGNQIKENEMSWSCGTYGKQERCIQGFVGRAEGKRPLGRLMGTWEDKINIYHREF